MKHTYYIDNKPFEVSLQSEFCQGKDEVLIDKFGDLTSSQDWFDEGYTILNSGAFFDYSHVNAEIEALIRAIIVETDNTINIDGFSLENYHKYVQCPSLHEKIIRRTRRLHPQDFGFDSDELIERFSSYLGVPLSHYNAIADMQQWIIVRINMPGSQGYNPAHKDVYEMYDHLNAVGRMVNVWIPICGVNEKAGLPVAPKTHRLSESEIIRSKAGSVMNEQKYSVNSILSWAGKTDLVTQFPNEGEFLMFSSHLIHGLGVNKNKDTTRMSLEFRLYSK